MFILKIGQYIKRLNTTKDTVRHYEELLLLHPIKVKKYKEYSEKDIKDFQMIKELQLYGLSLKDIQLIFEIKNSHQCGDIHVLKETLQTLTLHLKQLKSEEEAIFQRRTMLEKELRELRDYIHRLC